MVLHDARLTDYAVFGSASLEGVQRFIDMKTPGALLNQNNHWACYSQIRIGGYYGTGGQEVNPYFYCHYSMGGFDDLIKELQSKLKNIQFELLSENRFTLITNKPSESQLRWGSSGSFYLIKGDDIPDNHRLLGEIMLPVYKVTYSDEYLPKTLSHMNYYMGVSLRNSAYAELYYNSIKEVEGLEYIEKAAYFLKTFRESDNKLKTLLGWTTGHGSGHSTCAKSITEEQWLLIDDPERVNDVVGTLSNATQDGFFPDLAGIKRYSHYD